MELQDIPTTANVASHVATTAGGNARVHQGPYQQIVSKIKHFAIVQINRGSRSRYSSTTSTNHSIAADARIADRSGFQRYFDFFKTRCGFITVFFIVLGLIGLVVGLKIGLGHQSGPEVTTPMSVESVRPNSPLAVTGWQDPLTNDYRLRLFYQGSDHLLRYSAWASNDSWTQSRIISTAHTASNSTPLAAAVSLESNATYKLIYVDSSTNMRLQNYDDWLDANEQGVPVLFNDGSGALPITPSSQVASFWPFIVSQSSNDQLQWWYRGEGPALWTNVTLNIRGSTSSATAVVPASAEYLDEGRIFYRSTDGSLRDAQVYNVTTQTNDDQSSLDILIDQNSAVAAFAVARDETSNLTNTYVLYQDSDSTIQVVWQDDDTGWKGPRTYDVFIGADNGTDIACLTLSAWARTGVPIRISGLYEMSRCYFQVGGLVRETRFNGTSWDILGTVPI